VSYHLDAEELPNLNEEVHEYDPISVNGNTDSPELDGEYHS